MNMHEIRKVSILPAVFWRIFSTVFCTFVYEKINSSNSEQVPSKSNHCAVLVTSLPFNRKFTKKNLSI